MSSQAQASASSRPTGISARSGLKHPKQRLSTVPKACQGHPERQRGIWAMKRCIPHMKPTGCWQSPGREKEMKTPKRRDRNSKIEARKHGGFIFKQFSLFSSCEEPGSRAMPSPANGRVGSKPGSPSPVPRRQHNKHKPKAWGKAEIKKAKLQLCS